MIADLHVEIEPKRSRQTKGKLEKSASRLLKLSENLQEDGSIASTNGLLSMCEALIHNKRL